MKSFINKKVDKKLITNIISLIGVQGVNYIIPLVTLPFLVRTLEPYGYGVLSFSIAITQYFVLLTDYGFNLSATQKVAINRINKEKITSIFWNVQSCKLILMILGLIFLFILKEFNKDINDHFDVFICAYGLVLGSFLFPMWLFQGKEEIHLMAIINIISRIISIPLIFFFVKSVNDIWIAAAINSITSIFAGLVSLFYIFRKKWITLYIPRINNVIIEFKDGFHLFISSVSISLYTTSTTVILGIVLGPVAVGYFVAADKIRLAVQGLINPISQAIYPKINTEMQASEKRAFYLIRKLLAYQSLCTLLVSLLLFYFSSYIINIIYGEDYQISIVILKILSFIPFLVGVSNVFGIQTMIVMGFKKQFSAIVILSGILNISILYPLLKIYGVTGASISVIITETFVTLLMLLFLLKKNIPVFKGII